jgi:hypothetical protein
MLTQFAVSTCTAEVVEPLRHSANGDTHATRAPVPASVGVTQETRHVCVAPPYDGPAWLALSMLPSCPEYAPPEIATSPAAQEQSSAGPEIGMQFAVSVVTGTGVEASLESLESLASLASLASEVASFAASIVVESPPASVATASLPASVVDPEDDPDDDPDVDPDDPDVDPDDDPAVDPDDDPDDDPELDPLPEPELLPCESGTEPSNVPFVVSPPQPDAAEAIRATTLRQETA